MENNFFREKAEALLVILFMFSGTRALWMMPHIPIVSLLNINKLQGTTHQVGRIVGSVLYQVNTIESIQYYFYVSLSMLQCSNSQ